MNTDNTNTGNVEAAQSAADTSTNVEATVSAVEAPKAKGGPQLKRIPLSQIEVEDGFNARTEDNYGDIRQLATSIKEMGQLEAVEVTKVKGEDRYILTDGHRRIRAMRLLQAENPDEVLFVTATSGPENLVDRLYSQWLHNDGQANTEYERGVIVQRLLAEGEKQKEIVAKLGMKNVQEFYILKTMFTAPAPVLEHLRQGNISGTTVVAIVKEFKGNEDAQIEAVESAIAEAQKEAERRGLEKKVATVRHTNKKTPAQLAKALFEKLEALESRNKNQRLVFGVLSGLYGKLSMKKIMEMVETGDTSEVEVEGSTAS